MEGDVPGKVLAGRFKGFCVNNFPHVVWPAPFCFLFASPSADLCRERGEPDAPGGPWADGRGWLFFSFLKIYFY